MISAMGVDQSKKKVLRHACELYRQQPVQIARKCNSFFESSVGKIFNRLNEGTVIPGKYEFWSI